MTSNTSDHGRPVRRVGESWSHRHVDERKWLRFALDSGLTGASPVVDRYEQALRESYDAHHALAVSSGAAAVGVAWASIDCSAGDEVIVPPTCPLCTVFPIQQHGLLPVFCDVLPDDFGLDPAAVAAAVGPRTRGIMEVPMFGYPTAADDLKRLAERLELPLILDLAHGHMVKRHGHWLARYADVACFSTHEGKYLSTGEGGFVLTDSSERDARMRAYTRFGNLDGKTFGLNFKLSGLQAAVGLARLGSLERHAAVRRRHRDFILGRVRNPHVRELPVIEGGEVSGYVLLMQAVASDGRRLVDYLDRHGVPSDIKKYDNRPLYEYPVLAKYRRDCPRAAALLRSLTTIPLHPDLTEDELIYIANTLNAYEP